MSDGTDSSGSLTRREFEAALASATPEQRARLTVTAIGSRLNAPEQVLRVLGFLAIEVGNNPGLISYLQSFVDELGRQLPELMQQVAELKQLSLGFAEATLFDTDDSSEQ